MVCAELPQEVKWWHPQTQGPWARWHPVLHHLEVSPFLPFPVGTEPSTHWMETHFMSWAPRA